MDFHSLFEQYKPLLKKHWFPLSLGIVGVMFFAYGLIGLFVANRLGSEDIVFEASSAGENSAEIKTVVVDIEGSVVKPGVYKLPQESRIQDGLVAAGGISAQADREYIARNLNLAMRLTDGAKAYIPAIGETAAGASALKVSSGGVAAGALININTSSQLQLEALPGIGPVTAQKIIAGRPYGSVQELLDKKIVRSKVFEQIKEKVSVY